MHIVFTCIFQKPLITIIDHDLILFCEFLYTSLFVKLIKHFVRFFEQNTFFWLQ
jgi:hypothetical protein